MIETPSFFATTQTKRAHRRLLIVTPERLTKSLLTWTMRVGELGPRAVSASCLPRYPAVTTERLAPFGLKSTKPNPARPDFAFSSLT